VGGSAPESPTLTLPHKGGGDQNCDGETMTTAPNRRSAFTLVEMMVASALIIFMMYIIASAFQSGLTSFRTLKTQGDMQEKLRGVATALRMDLTAEHFGGNFDPTNQGPFVSSQRLTDQTWTPPQKGYFRISQAAATGSQEGIDPDGAQTQAAGLRYFQATAATAQNTYLQFTVNLTDGHPATRDARGRRDQMFASDSASLTAYSRPDYNMGDASTPFSSNWAEITYFLQNNLQTTDGAVPLYTLFRRQKLLVEPNAAMTQSFPLMPTTATASDFPDVSMWYTGKPTVGYALNGPSDVTEPVRRWGMNLANWTAANAPEAYGRPKGPSLPFNRIIDEASVTTPLNPYADPKLGSRVGGDVLLTDVVNFEIKVLWDPVRQGTPNSEKFFPLPTTANPNPTVTNVIADSTEPSALIANNPDFPFSQLPVGLNSTTPMFDTWSANNDLSGAAPYVYGVHPTAVDARDNYPIMSKAASSSDPNYANWNSGHLTPPTAQPIPLTPAPAASIPRWQPGVLTQDSLNTNIPLRVRVRAIQIKIRLWDRKSSQTRQLTIIQDL
jgi:type II secretory pathway pseudopilin PulG